MGRQRPRTLERELRSRFPELDQPVEVIRAGRVLVDGRIIANPSSLVLPRSSVAVRPVNRPRGAVKLDAALQRFGVEVAGRLALDLGASTGGFTSVLLGRGASLVYAVDVGHGQLLGSLRQDKRVVNLESTNLAQLDRRLVPDPAELVTADLSFTSLATAIPQLDPAILAVGADLVALVKPMFELGLRQLPTSAEQLGEAVDRAAAGIRSAGWEVRGRMESPVSGANGAVEFFVHAKRPVTPP